MQSDNEYVFTWVTDPYDVEVTNINSDIISALNSERFSIISSSSDTPEQSITFYSFLVQPLPGNERKFGSVTIPKDHPELGIKRAIRKIQYQPVILTFNYIDIIDVDNINGLLTLAKYFTEKILKTKIENVETVTYITPEFNIMYFIPYLDHGYMVYRKFEAIINLQNICNLNDLKGFQILTDNGLLDYSLISMYNDSLRLSTDDIIKVYDTTLIKVGLEGDYELGRIRDDIDRLKYDGYTGINVSLQTFDQKYYLYSELADIMDMQILQTPQFIIKSNINLDRSTEDWFKENVERIKVGELPIYRTTIKRHWVEPSTALKAKYYVAAIRAYINMIDTNPLLNEFVMSVKILDDLTIEIPITDVKDIENFNEQLRITSTHISQWLTVTCNNDLDCLTKRWYLQQLNVDVPNLVVLIDGVRILVVTISDSYALELPTSFDIARVSLEVELKKYSNLGDNKWAVYGLYNYGPIYGLLNEPKKYLVEQNGNIEMLKLPYIAGVMMGMKNGDRFIELLAYQSMNQEEVREKLEELWKSGWLLSKWGKAYFKKTNKLSSNPVNNNILIDEYGKRGLGFIEFLNSTILNLQSELNEQVI